MQVRWTTPAAQDLEEITNYILRDSPAAALAVARKLFDAANSLESLSNRGRLGRASGTRELVISSLPFIIVYQVTAEAVHILHINHGARNWPEQG
jgi:addiction module RelE/StbE family toxin